MAVGGAVSGATGPYGADSVIGAAGGGAYAAANISDMIEAYVDGGSVVMTTSRSGGDISLTATDSTKLIDSDAFGIAAAYAATTGLTATAGSAAVGVGIAQNTVSNTVKAYINASNAVADAGISLDATSGPDVHSLGLGVAAAISRGSDLTGALAGAGSAATNSVNDTIAAYIIACTTAEPITTGTGGVSVTASDTSNLTADAAAFSLAAALAQSKDPAVAIAVGASIAENNVGTGSGESIEAYIYGSDVSAAGPVVVSASSTATINSLAIGGAFTGSKGQGVSVAVAGSGAGTYSTVQQTIFASIQDGSSVTTTSSGSVSVSATDSSSILADAGGVSISVAYGNGTSVSGSVGAANANNTMEDTVTAFIDSSLVSAGGGITVQARSVKAPGSTASDRVDALAFGVAFSGALSTGNGASIALDGAGSSATNTIDNNISAYINNCNGLSTISASGSGLSSGASALVVSASDDLSVRADSGGYALAIASSKGGISGAVGIGAAESKNEVGQNGGDSVLAYIHNSTVVVTGPVIIGAVTTASFDALGIGFSGAGAGTSGSGLTGALAGAGAGTLNNVAMTIEALIDGGSSVTANSGSGLTGNVSLTATDNSMVTADAGGVAIAIAAGLGGGGGQAALTIGASVANNTVANTIHAAIIGSRVNASGAVAATAQTVANPDKTLTFAPSAVNTSSNQIRLPNHGLHTGDPVIYNDGGGTPIGGLVSGQSYFAIVVDSNTIELALSKADAIASTQVPITFTSAGTSGSQSLVTLSPTVAAFAIGGALSGSGGEGLSLGFAGAGAGAINTVNNDIEAYIQGCSGGSIGVTAGSGGVTLQAVDDSVIHADTGGFAVAIAIETQGGAGSLSVGASKSDNEIGQGSGQFVKAFIDSSTVTTPGTVSVESLASAQIDSLAMGGSGSGAGSASISIAGAVAGAVTINNIEEQVTSAIQNSSSVTTSTISGAIDVYATDASIITGDAGGVAVAIAFGAEGAGSGSVGFAQANNTIDDHVTADISASQATADGDVSILATSVASISALSFGGSGAGSGGSGINVALAGAGAGANNTTGDDIYAFITNCQGTFSVGSVLGSVALGATDNQSIVSSAGGGSVAIAAGSTAAGVAITAVQTNNTIGDTVESYIDGSVVQALSDEVTVEATTPSSSHIKSLGVAASVGGGASVASLGLAGGGAGATNMITDTVQADIDQSSKVSAALLVSVMATDNAQVTTTVGSGALAAGAVGASIGVSVQTTTVNDTVTAYINAPVSVTVGNVVVTSGSTVTITGLAVATSVALGGGAFAGSGANTESTIEGTVSAYVGSSGTITVPFYGDITVNATSTQNAQSNSYGASLAGGTVSVAIGVSLGTATIDGTTEAYMSGTVDQGANLTVEATNSSTAGATIYALAGGLGLGGSGAGANGTVNLNPIVTSYIDGTVGMSSSKRFDGDVYVLAASQSAATANCYGVAVGGAVAVGVSLAKSEVDRQVSAYIGKGATIHASGSISVETFQNVDINGNPIDNVSTAIAQASAGSLVGTGTGASANADNSPTVSAYVASGANLNAGDGILIQALANNVASAQTHVIAVSLGASVGASLATATTEGGTEAFNDGSIDQSGSVTITARAADTAGTTAFAAAGGIASGSGDVATSTVEPIVEAFSDGPTLDSAGAVNVTATDTPEATATGFGVSGSATIDVGVSQARATDSSIVTASAGGSGDSITAGSLSLTATMAIPSGASSAASEATGSAVRALGVVATSSTADNTGSVSSSIGDGTDLFVSTSITVQATDNSNQNALATSHFGGITAAGSNTANANSSVQTNATVGSGVNISAGGPVGGLVSGKVYYVVPDTSSSNLIGLACSYQNAVPDSGNPATIDLTAPAFSAGLQSLTPFQVVGATPITFNPATDLSGGMIDVGSNNSFYLGEPVVYEQSSGPTLAITANGTDTNFAHSVAGSGGLVAGSAAAANTTTGGGATAEIDDNTNATNGTGTFINVSSLTITATHTAQFDSQTNTLQADAAGFSGSWAHNVDSSTVNAHIGNFTQVVTQNIQVLATNATEKDLVPSGQYNVQAGSGGVLQGNAAQSTTTISNYTTADLGSDANVEVTGSTTDPGIFEIYAKNIVNGSDTVDLDTGGVIDGSDATSTIDAGTNNAKALIDPGAKVTTVGAVNLDTETNSNINVAPTVHTYGAASPGAIDGEATIDEDDAVEVGSGATIVAQGDINLNAGGDMSGNMNNLNTASSSYELNASAIPAFELKSDCTIGQTNTVAVDSGALLESAANANLTAQRNGNAITDAYGTGKDWVTGLASGISSVFGSSGVSGEAIHEGTGLVNTTTSVTVNGKIELGINNTQSLTIASDILSNPTDFTAIGPILFTMDTESLESDFTQALTNDENLLTAYAGDTQAETAYESDIQEIQAEMMSAGLATDESGTTVPILEDAVPFVKLAPIFAESGMITVTGSNLLGSGVLEAPGNISIDITNNSPAFLSVNSITIQQSSGGILFYDGKTVTTNAQIAAINTGFIRPDFSGIQTSSQSSDPSVTINNTYNASDPANAGNTFVNPNIDLDGDISAPPTVLTVNSQGSLLVTGSIDVGTANLHASADFIQSYTPGIDTFLGDPSTTWSSVTALTEAVAPNGPPLGNSLSVDAYANGTAVQQAVATALATPAGNLLAGNDIFISAQYLNIDGTIQSGQPDQNLTIDSTEGTLYNSDILGMSYSESMTDAIAAANMAYSESNSGNPMLAAVTAAGAGLFTNDYKDFLLPEPTADAVEVYWDAQTGQLILGNTAVTGGLVSLYGQMLSTGAGTINVLDGYGEINVQNDTTYPLVTQGLSTGGGAAGELKITDTGYENSAGQPLVTEYYRQGGQVYTTTYYSEVDGTPVPGTTTIGSYSGPNSGQRSASYQPAAARFVWQDGQDLSTTTTNVYKDTSWIHLINNINPQDLVSTSIQPGTPRPLLDGEYIDTAATDASFVGIQPGQGLDEAAYEYNYQLLNYSAVFGPSAPQPNGTQLDLPGNTFYNNQQVTYVNNFIGGVTGLTSGDPYDVIVDPSNPDLISLSSTENGPAIALSNIQFNVNLLEAFTQSVLYSSTKKWYGTTTYAATTITTVPSKSISTNSIRADQPIEINFIGLDEGAPGQDVSVTTDGDLLIGGSISNAQGTTTLSAADGAIVQDTAGATIGGTNITLTAANGIGVPIRPEDTGGTGTQGSGPDVPIELNLTNSSATSIPGVVNATSTNGDIDLDDVSGSLQFDQIETSQQTGNVILAADENILSSFKTVIQGGSVTLDAQFGSVGSLGGGTADSPGRLADAIVLDMGDSSTNVLNVAAFGDVNVTQSTGDLRLNKIVSSSGSVRVDVPDGSLIDGNNVTVTDTENLAELQARWNSMLATTSTAQASVDATINAYESEIEQEYQTYWQFRDEQPDPSVYDPTFEVTLSPEELPAWEQYYENQGLTPSQVAAAIMTLENTDTQEYHTFNAIFGKLGTTYNPRYMYFANQTPLTSSASLSFGPSNITSTSIIPTMIDLPGNGFVTGTPVVYTAGSGSFAASLTSGGTYYVVVDSRATNAPDEISLAPSYADATAALPVVIPLLGVTGTNNSLSEIFPGPNVTFSASNTSGSGMTGYLLNLPGNAYTTGQAVEYEANGGSVSGLTDGEVYFVVAEPSNPNFVGLAASYASATAQAPVLIDLETITGGQNSLSEIFQSFGPGNLASGDSIYLPQNVFSPGQEVVYQADGGSVGGLSDGSDYYVVIDPGDTGSSAYMGLAATQGGPAIPLGPITGTGNYLSEVDVEAQRAAWSQSQLQNSMAMSIIEPQTFPSTVQAIPDADIEGEDVALVVSQNIGAVSGQDVISLPISASLPGQEALDLAVAQLADITFYNAGNVVVTPESPDFDPVKLTVNLEKGVSIENTGVVNATAGGNIDLVSGKDIEANGPVLPINIGQVTATGGVSSPAHPAGVVRILGLDGLTNDEPTGTRNVIGGDLFLEGGDTGGIGSSIAPIVIDLAVGSLLEEANAEYDVDIDEVNGSLNLVTAASTAGSVSLTADQSILNGNTFNDLNVEGERISLIAGADHDTTSTIGSSAGAVDVELGGGSIVAPAAEDIYLTAQNGTSLNVENIDSQFGSLFLSAAGALSGGSITEAADVPLGTAGATGSSITLTADPVLGTIGSAGQAFEIGTRPGGTLSTSSGLDQFITQATGDLALNAVTTLNGGTAFIEAPDGNIANGAASGEDILAGGTYLFASGSIGTSTNPITTSVGSVQGQSTTGSTYVVNSTGVTVGGVNAGDDMGLKSGGVINLDADGPVMTMQDVTSGGNTTFTATNDAPGDIVIAAGVIVESMTGSVAENAQNNFTSEPTSSILAPKGTITIAGDYDDEYGNGAVITVDGALSAPNIFIDGNGASAVISLNNFSGINNAPGQTAGLLLVSGGPGNNQLIVNDSSDTSPQSGTLTASTITGLGIGGSGLVYNNIANNQTDPPFTQANEPFNPNLEIELGTGTDAFSIPGTKLGTSTLVTNTGPQQDSFSGGSPSPTTRCDLECDPGPAHDRGRR